MSIEDVYGQGDARRDPSVDRWALVVDQGEDEHPSESELLYPFRPHPERTSAASFRPQLGKRERA